MGSHWPHWTVKRSLCALAVLNGGSICLWYPYVYICTGISLYFLISWLFQMGSHWQYRYAKSSLFSLAVSHGGGHWQMKVCLPNLSSFLVLLLLHRALSFLIRNERPKMVMLLYIITVIARNKPIYVLIRSNSANQLYHIYYFICEK